MKDLEGELDYYLLKWVAEEAGKIYDFLPKEHVMKIPYRTLERAAKLIIDKQYGNGFPRAKGLRFTVIK